MGNDAGPAVGVLERAAEFAVLRTSLDCIGRGRGGLVVVEGSAGIGKTRLLSACGECAAKRGMAVVRARGDELVMESSFAAIRELLWAHVRAEPGLLDGAGGLAGPVFDGRSLEQVDRDHVAAVLHGLYWLVADLAERGPLVMLIDDAHWLDAASARFLAYLVRRVDSLPVLVAVATRPGTGGSGNRLLESLWESAMAVLTPPPLSEAAAGVLVRAVLGPNADEELCRACHRATRGNPFYLHALTAALRAQRQQGSLGSSITDGTLGAGALAKGVLVRLTRLGEDCERLAQALAVLAPDSPLRHAGALAGLERERAQEAADSLRAEELIARGAALSFVHPIVREAVAEQTPQSRRAALHADAARMLLAEGAPADQVAVHLLAAEPYAEGWVVEALRTAARVALAQGAPEAAVSYLRRAVAEPPEAGLRLDVLLELGQAEALQPSVHDFLALRQALGLARGAAQRAGIAAELAWGLSAVTRFSEAAAVLEDALRDAEHLELDQVDHLEALLIGGGIEDLNASRRLLLLAERHFARASRGDVHDPVMLASLALAGAVSGREAGEVAALARLALDDDSLLERGAAYGAATSVLTMSDHLGEAAAAQNAAIRWAQRRGSAPMFVSMSVHRGDSALRVGELEVAEGHLRRAQELGHEVGAGPFALMFLIGVLLERAEVQEASRLVDTVELTEPRLGSWPGVIVLAQRGNVRVARGELEAGAHDLLDAHRRMRTAGVQLSVLVDWAPTAAAALAQLGRGDEARRLLRAELAEASAAGAPRRHGMSLSAAGLLDPGSNGLMRLREAVRILELSPARIEHARALVNLGRGLRDRGERLLARDAVSRGLDIAHRYGAEALAARAREELNATGGRPRRDARTGPSALTPAELRTAHMASGKLTNREIAQALFVSTKTVEAQLSRAYAKLGVEGRGELAAALARVTHPFE
jgi:DNA-binding CsgD family transcriptional regulator